ncbi:MAG: WYL domain-containing protein [Burkholderiales bacterium]|jgi:predicted DNA-binding transcriptional regulator YafY|nr:WYL domain-containing protein [Burkholderiales bacterium]
MPHSPKHDTLARLLELLQAIPHRRYASAPELTQALADRGFAVNLRSVQRDLQMLREHLPLELRDDSKPHGWRWKSTSGDGITGMSAPEALMVALVEQHLQAALPASLLDSFVPVFEQARQRLGRLGPQSGTLRWPDKVRAISPGLVAQAPAVRRSVRRSLSEALLADRQIDARYAPGSTGQPAHYRLHPLGLVLRGAVGYLVATQGSGGPPGFYALHRFQQVELRPEPVQHPQGLTLEAALSRSQGQFGLPPEAPQVALRLACDAVLAGLLTETPLAPDQHMQPMADGRFEVQATVPNSWELRWWILGRAAAVEVLAPAELRDEVAASLTAAAARYAPGPSADTAMRR